MFSKLRSGLTYANVIATLALFLALGGGAYAAFKLPTNSVGSKQIKKNAVNSSKVANGSLLAGDFKAGQLPAGAQGLKGDQGDPCPASDLNCKGPKGDTGPQGPGAISVDADFPFATFHDTAVGNGMRMRAICHTQPMPGEVQIQIQGVASDYEVHGFGTRTVDGTTARVNDSDSGKPNGDGGTFYATAPNSVNFDITVGGNAPGETRKWTQFHLWGVRATACHIHGLIIPPS
jgi:hypothetical protein